MEKTNPKYGEARCTMRAILDILGGKWSMPIIYVLFAGTKRFSELERSIPGINTRMLAKELKNMEENGIVVREIFATVPPTVEYTLTPRGRRLEPILTELHKWGEELVV